MIPVTHLGFRSLNIYESQYGRRRERSFVNPLYYFQPLQEHLDISQVIAAESSPLYLGRDGTRTGKPWFPKARKVESFF